VSHSPDERTHHVGDPYRLGWEALFELLYTGGSLSGRERHCCYLNQGTFPFADVSAIAGFDFLDDGRALGLVDWDGDGGLDVWAVNRTAPRVRFLHNVVRSGNHFLSLKLQGVTCNRDAIGARVEVYGPGSKGPVSIETVRAGEGYLAQSTKWVQFGLGAHDQISKVVVRWPGGETETFKNLKIDRPYRLVQGSGIATPAPRRQLPQQLEASLLNPPLESDAARIVLAGRIPLPAIEYETYVGKRLPLPLAGRPLIVSLWASWCQPCLRELAEWNQSADALRKAGLHVIALSVDKREDRPAAKQWIVDRQDWQFDSGFAPNETVEALNIVLRGLLDDKRPMPVPTTFLVDSSGRLATAYKGAISLDTLLRDAALLDLNDDAIFSGALPFPGIWVERPTVGPLTQLAIANQLIKSGNATLGKSYLATLVDGVDLNTLPVDAEARTALAGSQLNLGVKLADAGRMSDAIQALRMALELRPEYAKAHFNLGIALQSADNTTGAIEQFRSAIRLEPNHAEAHFNLGHAQFEAGKHADAVVHYQRAIDCNPEFMQAYYNLGHLLLVSGKPRQAVEQLQHAAGLAPSSADVRYLLANAYMLDQQIDLALDQYREVIALRPEQAQYRYNFGVALSRKGHLRAAADEFRAATQLNADYVAAMNGLARALIALPDREIKEAQEALDVIERAAGLTDHADLSILRTLASAHAAVGDFQQAVSIAERAIALAESSSVPPTTIAQLRKQREQYRAQFGTPQADVNSTPQKQEL
jgi:tetratricopeptide (TPR) repeat protein